SSGLWCNYQHLSLLRRRSGCKFRPPHLFNLDGARFAGYRTKTEGWLLTVREPPDESSVSRVRVPLAKPHICGATCPSDHPVVQLRENTRIYFREVWVRFPSGVPISTGRRVWIIGKSSL